MGLLIAVSDSSGKTSWPVESDRETVIGRLSACAIRLEDKGISRKHCAIVSGPSGFAVRDLGSVNGTFINGRRVTESALKSGDRLRVGFTEFEFRAETAADAAATRLLAAPVELLAGADPVPEPAPAPAAGPVPVKLPLPVPVPVARRMRAPAPAPAPARLPAPSKAVALPPASRLPALAMEFCSRCSGSIALTSRGERRARVVDGELLCHECLGRNSTNLAAVPVAERLPKTAVGAGGEAETGTPARGAGAGRNGHARPARGRAALARSAVRNQAWAWLQLGLSLTVLGVCLTMLPAAWLNFQRLLGAGRVAVMAIPLEEVGRDPLGVSLDARFRPEGGEEVSARLSAGPIARLQYDDDVRRAKAAGGVARFDVAYDTTHPARVALADRLFGLPALTVALLMVFWAAREALVIARMYRRPAVAGAK
ncbi:MAG TPA: FHA domain-containing protein [Planctomycetota bacterium]|nr:FHA domain-containing protein [Planctomycetota bacterium]